MPSVLILHGPSSSGKSTLAAAIRAQAGRPFLHLSIDHFRDSGAWDPAAYSDWNAARPAFFSGFHRAAAGFALAGNDVILELILDTPGWHRELRELLSGCDVLFAGLHTPLQQLTEREAARGNRAIGSAARDFHKVHRGLVYDLELDGTCPPRDNAIRVLAELDRSRPEPAFFKS